MYKKRDNERFVEDKPFIVLYSTSYNSTQLSSNTIRIKHFKAVIVLVEAINDINYCSLYTKVYKSIGINCFRSVGISRLHFSNSLKCFPLTKAWQL